MFKEAVRLVIVCSVLVVATGVTVYGQSCEQGGFPLVGPDTAHSYNIIWDPTFDQTGCSAWDFGPATERALTVLCAAGGIRHSPVSTDRSTGTRGLSRQLTLSLIRIFSTSGSGTLSRSTTRSTTQTRGLRSGSTSTETGSLSMKLPGRNGVRPASSISTTALIGWGSR